MPTRFPTFDGAFRSLSTDDFSPLQSGETEVQVAVVDQVELTRDAMGRDVATVTYLERTNQNQRQSFQMRSMAERKRAASSGPLENIRFRD